MNLQMEAVVAKEMPFDWKTEVWKYIISIENSMPSLCRSSLLQLYLFSDWISGKYKQNCERI